MAERREMGEQKKYLNNGLKLSKSTEKNKHTVPRSSVYFKHKKYEESCAKASIINSSKPATQNNSLSERRLVTDRG